MIARALTGLIALSLLGGCVLVVGPRLPWGEREPGLQETVVSGHGDAKVLVMDITGFISDQPTERALGLVQEQSTLARVRMELKKAADDPAVKALILRIDSPGGGVTASDEIYHLIKRYRAETGVPVIASLGGVAASGAYYIACSADTIMAHPTTVTGSIGVIIVGLNFQGLMNKLGIQDQTYTSGPHKDLLSPLREATPEERAIVQGVLDSLFARFKTVVLDNRPDLDRSHLDAITDGRIFAADTARDYGLVDSIGRVQDAIDLAEQRAGVEAARVIRYHRSGEPAETVYSQLAGGNHNPVAGAGDLPVPFNLSLDNLAGSQFLYLWKPGLNR